MRRLLAALLVGALLVAVPGARAAQETPEEYEVKAAFLYNFTKFVDWPPTAFASPSSKFVIGILGADHFGASLDSIADKLAKNRKVEVRRVSGISGASGCQILFVSGTESRHLSRVLDALAGAPVLTVSDIPDFTRSGGMIGFVSEGKRLRFQANAAAAQAAGLQISSHLLKLAAP